MVVSENIGRRVLTYGEEVLSWMEF